MDIIDQICRHTDSDLDLFQRIGSEISVTFRAYGDVIHGHMHDVVRLQVNFEDLKYSVPTSSCIPNGFSSRQYLEAYGRCRDVVRVLENSYNFCGMIS